MSPPTVQAKVAVLGGAGLTGRCAVRALAENKEISEGIVADLDSAGAERVAERFGGGKFKGVGLDVRDVESTIKIIRGCDVVVNGVQYYFNVQVMQAALKARSNYLDFGGLYHMTLKQLKLDDEFKKKDLLALVGMGGQPGVSNILARESAESMDEVHTIRIRDGSRDLQEGPSSFRATWSLDTFLDELSLDAPVFEGGKIVDVPPMSRKETVNFPMPVGTIDTYVTIHSEVATFPTSFKTKGILNVDWMEGAPGIMALKLLVDLGLASDKEVELGAQKVVPRRLLTSLISSKNLIGYSEDIVPDDWEATRVTVQGMAGGRKVERVSDVVIPPRPDWKLSCAQYGVGIPASIAARMICRGEVEGKGVLPPESCIDPSPFLSELKGYGFKVNIT